MIQPRLIAEILKEIAYQTDNKPLHRKTFDKIAAAADAIIAAVEADAEVDTEGESRA